MKKIILVGALALLGLSSCKKDYTCSCSIKDVDSGLSITSEELSTTISNSSKSDAESDCAKEEGTGQGTLDTQFPNDNLEVTCVTL
jgi:hypothetical protein